MGRKVNCGTNNIYPKSLRSIATHPKNGYFTSNKTKPKLEEQTGHGRPDGEDIRSWTLHTTHFAGSWFLLWLFKSFIKQQTHTIFFLLHFIPEAGEGQSVSQTRSPTCF